jgi:hypothetical protein
MNRFTLPALLASSLLAVAAFAQNPPPDRASPPVPPRPDAPNTPINPNQPAPAQAAPAEEPAPALSPVRELVFGEADADQDGRVSLNEYTTFVENRMATRSTEPVREETIQRFLDLDQNNDAFLSQSEATVQQQPPAQVGQQNRPR